MPGMGRASPLNSLSTPAMIRSRVDLPAPLRPSTPILAPGKKDKEMSLRISRLGGTTLPRRCMVKTYWDMENLKSEVNGKRNDPQANDGYFSLKQGLCVTG